MTNAISARVLSYWICNEKRNESNADFVSEWHNIKDDCVPSIVWEQQQMQRSKRKAPTGHAKKKEEETK